MEVEGLRTGRRASKLVQRAGGVNRWSATIRFPYMPWLRLTLNLVFRGLVNPADGLALARMAWRFRRRRWWARAPFLPLPAADYVKWRLHTAYGDEHTVPPAGDVIRLARWAARPW